MGDICWLNVHFFCKLKYAYDQTAVSIFFLNLSVNTSLFEIIK